MSPSTPDNATTANNNNTAGTTTSKQSAALEFEPPLACVRRVLKNALPNTTNVGKDASAAFARSCGIFVIYLTACANDFAREHKRQTITANDVLAAVKELEFDEFTPQLQTFLDRYRVAEKSKRDAKAKAQSAAKEAAAAAKSKEGGGEDDDEDDAASSPPPAKKQKTDGDAEESSPAAGDS